MRSIKLIVGLGNPGREYEGTRHNAGAAAVALFAREQRWVLKASRIFKSLIAEGRAQEEIIPRGRMICRDAGSRGDSVLLRDVAGWQRQEVTILCCLPQTFMNLSGGSVAGFVARKKIDVKNVLIVHDDVDLPLGTIRFKTGGSDGGHNGVESVIEHLGTRDFTRLRIGIGPKPALTDLSDFVLSRFCREEKAASAQAIARAAEAMGAWVREGSQKCMNAYNSKPR